MTDTLIDLPTEQPQPEPTGLTASHMVQMLRRHYLPEGRQPGGIFAPEIGSPCGKRRADLIWMPTTVAGGKGTLHGHEIKVTRADLIVELDDPAKADPWAQYCTHWWLIVAHPSLISGLTIPDAWGVMAPPSGRRTRSMTVVKEAPRLTPKDPAPGIARIAAWQMYATNERIANLEYNLADRQREIDRLRAEVAELRATGAHRDSKEAQRVARIVAAAEQRLRGEGISWARIPDEAVVDAIVDHAATHEAARSVRAQVKALVRTVQRAAAEPLSYALDEFQKAEQIADGLVKPKPSP